VSTANGAPGAPDVAIVGATGALGFGLAVRLAAAGLSVALGSRKEERARAAASRCRTLVPGGTLSGAVNELAVETAPVVILTVPFLSHAETLGRLQSVMRAGQLVIDATVPLAAAAGGKPTRMLGVWQGSAAEQTAELVPDGVGVVSGLHTVSAAMLTDIAHELDQDVLVCGDRKADKERAGELITAIPGLRWIDCGRLESSRTTESLTGLLIGVNIRYKTHAGVRITGVPVTAAVAGSMI
jgi:NADPH-dependent F420 reductase